MAFRTTAAAVAAALALAAAGCGDSENDDATPQADAEATPAQTRPAEAPAATELVRGRTVLELDDGFRQSLEDRAVELVAVEEATLDGGALTLPIADGHIRPRDVAGTLEHEGGLLLRAGDREAELRDFFVDTRSGTIYPRMAGARVSMFRLERGDLSIERDGDGISASGFDVSLTEDGAAALGDALEHEFDAGAPVGSLAVELDTEMPELEPAAEAGERADEIEQDVRDLAEDAGDALSPAERERLEEAARELDSLLDGR